MVWNICRATAVLLTLVGLAACGTDSGGSPRSLDVSQQGSTVTAKPAVSADTTGAATLADGARKLLNGDRQSSSRLPVYVSALKSVSKHCQDNAYGVALIVDTAATVLQDSAPVNRLAYLRKMAPSLRGKTNANCTDLSLEIQSKLAYGDPVPSTIPVSTHPSVKGAPNLTDCPAIRWPVAIPEDVVGQTLDKATDELFCFNIDAKTANGYDPLEHGSENFTLYKWTVTAVTPHEGTTVQENTPVLLQIKKA